MRRAYSQGPCPKTSLNKHGAYKVVWQVSDQWDCSTKPVSDSPPTLKQVFTSHQRDNIHHGFKPRRHKSLEAGPMQESILLRRLIFWLFTLQNLEDAVQRHGCGRECYQLMVLAQTTRQGKFQLILIISQGVRAICASSNNDIYSLNK